MKKIIAFMLTVLVFIGSCAFISLRTANSNSESYDDYGDNDEEAAKYYATFEYKDNYETETTAKHYSTTAYQSQSRQSGFYSTTEYHSQTRQANYHSTTAYQTQTKAYINHVALQGAVIVKQDGTGNYTYYRKCEVCGYIESNVQRSGYAISGKSSSSFYCQKCRSTQKIEFEHYSN